MHLRTYFSLVPLVFSLSFGSPSGSEKQSPSIMGKAGVGFGIPYGLLGAGGEIGNQYLAITAGAGHGLLVSELMYSAGVKVYFHGASEKWRPNASLLFGTTGLYLISGAVEASGTLLGVGVYLNLDHDVGQHGAFVFTYSLGFISHEDLPKDVSKDLAAAGLAEPDMGLPIKASIGFGYRFGG